MQMSTEERAPVHRNISGPFLGTRDRVGWGGVGGIYRKDTDGVYPAPGDGETF